MITLRPYQDDALNDVRAALTRNKAVLLQSPTGSGKTALAVTMLGNARQKGLRSFFICHRVELVDQTSRMFDEVGVPHGFIVAGRRPDPYQLVQVCSVDTLRNRLAAIEHPKLCVWDECHHVAAAGWSKILETYKDAYHVGLSATPERLDGRGLGNWFNEIVEGKPVLWLIENNWLCEYKLYDTSHNLNVENLSIKMGDYDKTQLQQTMDKPTITGDAIAHYKRLCNGKRAVIFAVSVMHSKNVVEQFNAAGIVAEHVDGATEKGERAAIIGRFRRGETTVLSNVQLIYEGFDLPDIEAIIMLRPTASLGLYLQMVGRALRPTEGKHHAIIIDHVGNRLRHGLPCDVHKWSLEAKKRKKKGEITVSVRQCPRCFAVHKPLSTCPECGYLYPVQPLREVDVVEGELKEVDLKAARRERMKEQGRARSYDELVVLGKQWGYKSPYMWAQCILKARGKLRR